MPHFAPVDCNAQRCILPSRLGGGQLLLLCVARFTLPLLCSPFTVGVGKQKGATDAAEAAFVLSTQTSCCCYCCCVAAVALPGPLKYAQVSFAGSCVANASRRIVVCIFYGAKVHILQILKILI